jgi:hypothetical protein
MGMDIAPGGIAYGATGESGPPVRLYTIDLSTGAVTPVGPIGLGSIAIAGISVGPVRNAFQFSQSAFSASEGAGAAAITVTRSNRFGAASVNFATSDGSAKTPGDYTATSGTLSFANGETSRTFTVPVKDKGQLHGTKTVNLGLSNAVGGPASVGTPATATLTIVYDDVVPAVSRVRASPSRARIGPRLPRISRGQAPVGTTISFQLSNPASVRIDFLRSRPGRKVGRRCKRPSQKNRSKRRCIRTVVAGRLSSSGHSGLNKVRFEGRLSGRKTLTPGRYTISVSASDRFGHRSPARTASLTMLAPNAR